VRSRNNLPSLEKIRHRVRRASSQRMDRDHHHRVSPVRLELCPTNVQMAVRVAAENDRNNTINKLLVGVMHIIAEWSRK